MGDPRRLLYPTDSLGNICGVDEFADRRNVFYFDITKCVRAGVLSVLIGCPTPAVCVEKCPSKYFSFLSHSRDDLICKYDVNISTSPLNKYELVHQEKCAAYYLDSAPVAGRCFPKEVTKLAENVVNNKNDSITSAKLQEGMKHLQEFVDIQRIGMKVFDDLRRSWHAMIVLFALATVLCYIVILLMRWIAFPVVLICILLFVGFFGFATYYCFNKYFELKDVNPNQEVTFKLDFDYYINLYQTWLVLGITAAILLVIVLLIAIFLRTRLLIAIALIKESSRAISRMMFTLVWPLFPLVLQGAALLYWAAAAVHLASTGDKNFQAFVNDTGIIQEIPCNPQENSTAGMICSFVQYGDDKRLMIVLQLFNLFMWFWILNFIIGLGQMTLAGAFASYYWAFDKKKDLPTFPLLCSLWRAIRYHLGSIAFGSLLIAIVQLIRVVLEYLDRKLKGAENRIAICLVKCLKCFFWCLEKFIKFINRNAYIMIAVAGKNFCISAKNAFSLILRNFIRAAILDGVTDFLLFLCKLFVVGGIGVLSFFFFSGELAKAVPDSWFSDRLKEFQPELNYYLIPVGVIAVGTYIIASLFFSVYSMAVDTLFLCFLEDTERNDGSAEKPYFMNKELLKILGKKNVNYKDIKSKVKAADAKAKKKKKKNEQTSGV